AGGLALLTGASASARAAGYSEFLDAVEFRGFRAEASYTTDSNVNRAPAGDALRDRILGVRVSAGGVIPLSARTRAAVQGFAGIQRSGALTRNISDGKSTVFDARNTSLRGNADWSLGRWDTVYLGAEYRRGDAVSTAPLTPGRADIADAVTVGPDDAYNNPAL